MFKFVVLCAFVATAVAEPEPALLLSSPAVQPYAAYSTVISPASTSISSQSSSVIHPTPITYASPLAFSHYIKKRSPQLLATPGYNYNPYGYYPYSSIPSAQVVAASSIVQTPIAYSGAQLPLAAHLIKKRSAPLLSTSYITPTTYLANPAYSTPLISTPYIQTPYYGASLPLVNTHFIKKRSAEPSAEPSAQTFIPSTYITPTTYYNTVQTTPYLTSPLYSNYYPASGIPLATTHLIKKRSAEPVAEPAAEPAAEPSADPQLLAYPSYPSTYYPGSPLIPTYPAATYIKAAPLISTNPYVYSTFIKK